MGFKEEDLLNLCFESMKDIFQGNTAKDIIARSNVWKAIQNKKKQSDNSNKDSTAPNTPTSTHSGEFGKPVKNSTPTSASVPKPSPNSGEKSFKTYQCPQYVVYSDPDLDHSANTLNKMPKELIDRLVRGVIDGMCALSNAEPFSRWPHHSEVREMARSVGIRYPSVKDADGSLGTIQKKLTRRLDNKKHTSKKHVLTPKSTKPKRTRPAEAETEPVKPKRKMLESNENSFQDCSVASKPSEDDSILGEHDDDDDSNGNSDEEVEDDEEPMVPAMQARFYNQIQNLQNKGNKTKVDSLNFYLNKEFPSRRNWIRFLEPQTRCKEMLSTYSCFKDHIEIIEEVRRNLKIDSTTHRLDFTKACVKRLESEVDDLIYYGVKKNLVDHSDRPSLTSKLTHLVRSLSDIFPKAKKPKKTPDLVVTLQAHSDPSVWASKRIGNAPVLVLDHSSVYIVVGSSILSSSDIANMSEMVVAYLGTFYLLDFDYPAHHELGLSILHYFVFNDNSTVKEILSQFNDEVNAYSRYKNT